MDDALFEALVDAHYQGLYRFALTLARRGEEAADLTQETFYRFATKGSQLRDVSKAKSWLYTTLYRQFLMGRRRETRFPRTDLGGADRELPVVEPDAGHRLDAGLVLDGLDQLDETYRVPLALFYLGDHSYKEIAAVLDVPIGTVMSRLSRGKSLLRKELESSAARAGSRIISLNNPLKSEGGNL